MTIEGLKYAYNKLYSFLGLKSNPDVGLTVIVAPQFMLVCPIGQSYHTETRRVGIDFEYSEE